MSKRLAKTKARETQSKRFPTPVLNKSRAREPEHGHEPEKGKISIAFRRGPEERESNPPRLQRKASPVHAVDGVYTADLRELPRKDKGLGG